VNHRTIFEHIGISGRGINMAPRGRRGGRKAGFRSRRGLRAPKGPIRTAVKNEIKRVLNKNSETKMRTWFGGLPFPQSSSYPGSVQAQNGLITSNTTDIHALIPMVAQGVDDYQRIGTRISPVSLVADFDVTINQAYLNSNNPVAQNVVAVFYFLQHKIYKDYTTLGVSNNFDQLLDVGDGTTVRFGAHPVDESLPVAKQFYSVLKKMVIPLRCSGQWINGTTGADGQIGNNNSDNFHRRFSVNLTKHLPKVLTYPETLSGSGGTTTLWPTNSSMFWAVGVYNMDLTVAGAGQSPPSYIQVQYVS